MKLSILLILAATAVICFAAPQSSDNREVNSNGVDPYKRGNGARLNDEQRIQLGSNVRDKIVKLLETVHKHLGFLPDPMEMKMQGLIDKLVTLLKK